MASCRLVFTFLVLSVIQCYALVDVPVFLWGDLAQPSVKGNPLQTTSEHEFKSLLTRQLNSKLFTVVFVEPTLSVEDLSRKDAGETSFPYLQANVADAIYLPSVEDAVPVITSSLDADNVEYVILTKDGLTQETEPQNGKVVIISLEDAREGESRAELLRRHNDFMESKFAEYQAKVSGLVAVFTARNPSWTVTEAKSRVRRQAADQTLNHDYILDYLRLYVDKLQLQDKSKHLINFTQITGNSTIYNETTQILNKTLVFNDNSITFNFQNRAGYWMLNTIGLTTPNITEVLFPTIEIYSLVGWSYRCAQNVRFQTTVNDTNEFILHLDNLKIQPFFNLNETEFGESFNCSGFFSIAIWAGLFVVFILLAITFFGITMMMDIKTMDRFDDPKGKTITINTSE